MADLLRHRQTKGAATDMVDLTPPRHIPTLPKISVPRMAGIGASLPLDATATNDEVCPTADLRGSANKRPRRVDSGASPTQAPTAR